MTFQFKCEVVVAATVGADVAWVHTLQPRKPDMGTVGGHDYILGRVAEIVAARL